MGDSTKLTDVRRLVGSARIDMLLTDPPYGVDYHGAAGEIANDTLSDDDFTAFLANAFRNAASVMRPGASFYIWFSFSRVSPFLTAMRESGLVFHQVLVWLKNQFTLGRSDYQNKFEPCFGGDAEPDVNPQFYGWKEGQAHTFRYDRKQSTVLQFDKPSKSSLHPTMKPVPLFDYLMKAGTSIGDNVLDLFAGSGTTLIAGEQNGRNVYCMEYDPHYADVIISRWEKLTGKKAERIMDGMEDGNGG